ncbi:dicarboxylate/amino acid:cation symporter [Phenylobacterium conjunctum]|uniref:Dicarboxylate/amino acid:cation symporter n=1 Tax=Phenylobacterium conjunctum TaxID=1298959 RepID=A0ABW3T6T0_9CAUL
MNSLTLRILAGLILGLAIGATLAALHSPFQDQLVTYASALGGVWLDSLRMTIIPLVFSLLVVGAAQAAGTVAGGGVAGRALLTFGVMLLIATTATAILTPALLAVWPPPAEAAAGLRKAAEGQAAGIPPVPPLGEWLKSFVPANPIKAAADGAVASICLFALVFGMAASRLSEDRRGHLFALFDAVQATMMVIVDWVLKLAPFGVFFLALVVGDQTGFGAVGVLGQYVIVVSIMCLMAGGLGLLMAIFGGKIAPGRLFQALIPVEAMAISTQSSLACLPLMLETTERLGVKATVRGVVMPLAVSVFRLTSPPGNLAVAIYVAHIYGVHLDPARLAIGVVVACLVSLATVGVASSVTFFTTLVPISMAMGLPLDLLPLLLAVETLPDFSRTVGNVTAHVGVTCWADRWGKTSAAAQT